MNVTLFGATGETGKYLIDEALKRGIDVTVFARSSSQFENSSLIVVRGELTDKDRLTEAIRGSDAVLSALGPSSPKHPRDLPITKGMNAIMSVMKQENVKRLIAVSTGTAVDPGDGLDLKVWLPALLVRFALPSSYQDIIGLAKTIRDSDLDWTMVRVPFLKNRPASNRLNVGLYGHSKHSLTISREDVARFMFNQISSREFVHQAPGISSR
jgi:putative NADH-flavin reductase